MTEYAELDTEAAWRADSVPSDFAKRGSLAFHDYSTRYREGMDLVLKVGGINYFLYLGSYVEA